MGVIFAPLRFATLILYLSCSPPVSGHLLVGRMEAKAVNRCESEPRNFFNPEGVLQNVQLSQKEQAQATLVMC